MKIDRRTFTKSLAAAAGILALPSWSTKAEAARLPVNRVTKIAIREFFCPLFVQLHLRAHANAYGTSRRVRHDPEPGGFKCVGKLSQVGWPVQDAAAGNRTGAPVAGPVHSDQANPGFRGRPRIRGEATRARRTMKQENRFAAESPHTAYATLRPPPIAISVSAIGSYPTGMNQTIRGLRVAPGSRRRNGRTLGCQDERYRPGGHRAHRQGRLAQAGADHPPGPSLPVNTVVGTLR